MITIIGLYLGLGVLNGTFNNISVILWRSVLLVVDTVVPRENHRPAASHWQTITRDLSTINHLNTCKKRSYMVGIWTDSVIAKN